MRADRTESEWTTGKWALLGCFIGNMLGVHSLPIYGQSIFVAPLAADFGWSRLQISLGSTIVIFSLAVSAPLAGYLVDKFKLGRVIAASALAMSLGFYLLSLRGADIRMFYLTLAFIAFFGGACSTLTYSRIVSAHFSRGRGTALGVAAAGNGVASILTPLILAPLIGDHGWRPGYVLLAAVTLIAAPIVVALARMPATALQDGSMQPKPLDGSTLEAALRDPLAWKMAAAFFLIPLGVAGLITHLIPLLTDAGLSPAQAALRASGIGIAVVAARLVTGVLIDRFFAPYVGAALIATSASAMLLLALGGSEYAFVAALGTGLAIGAEIDLVGYLTARYFGFKAYGRIFGIFYSILLVGSGFSPLIYGWAYDRTGSYASALVMAATVLGIAAVLLLTMRPLSPPREGP